MTEKHRLVPRFPSDDRTYYLPPSPDEIERTRERRFVMAIICVAALMALGFLVGTHFVG